MENTIALEFEIFRTVFWVLQRFQSKFADFINTDDDLNANNEGQKSSTLIVKQLSVH